MNPQLTLVRENSGSSQFRVQPTGICQKALHAFFVRTISYEKRRIHENYGILLKNSRSITCL